ncbi:hypothetical protein WKI71_28275 [Streptomyces sp. MS1.AVA.1]|uniref:Uncharacterized protein n=1 Tax=Streptomyces machairae TaxID=3134109 RepID=A0ABU8UPQ5_9ACTN
MDPPWPTGQRGKKPREILRAAIQPVVSDADHPVHPLSAVDVTTCQVRHQPVESRPQHSLLGGAATVVAVCGYDDAALFMRDPLVDPQLIAHTVPVTLP